MLVVPPPIGRYYFLDLRPGRSFVEYSVSRGLQTFLLSWRNPGPDQADWDIDTYAERILTAIDAVREATGSEDVNVIGFCAGGILNTAVLNHLAAKGDDRVHTASYAVTLLDFGQSAPIGAFSGAKLLSLARWNSKRSGVISARAMGNAFTWMRPNDLVWNYWVNNYLMGEDPPVFDILSWNADGTNLPAALHRQFLDIFEHNPLPEQGAMEALGTPIDLRQVKVPTYVTGAINDHLTPWKGCYRTTQLMSGETTFALSNAGHIASLVNPPGNPKANYYTAPAGPQRDRRRRGWRAPRTTPDPGGSTGPTGPSSARVTRYRRPRPWGPRASRRRPLLQGPTCGRRTDPPRRHVFVGPSWAEREVVVRRPGPHSGSRSRGRDPDCSACGRRFWREQVGSPAA